MTHCCATVTTTVYMMEEVGAIMMLIYRSMYASLVDEGLLCD